jgi:hypothetical protein
MDADRPRSHFRGLVDVIAAMASNATNSVLRARLSDVSWILDRKREGLGAAAISAYLDILEKVDAGTLSFRFDEQHAPLCYEARDCLRRTLQIARGTSRRASRLATP